MVESLIQHLQKNAILENSIDVERFEATFSQISACAVAACSHIDLAIPEATVI
jgi:hypothetical protein